MTMMVMMTTSMVTMVSQSDIARSHDHAERQHPLHSAKHSFLPCSRVSYRDILIPTGTKCRCHAMLAVPKSERSPTTKSSFGHGFQLLHRNSMDGSRILIRFKLCPTRTLHQIESVCKICNIEGHC